MSCILQEKERSDPLESSVLGIAIMMAMPIFSLLKHIERAIIFDITGGKKQARGAYLARNSREC